MFVFKAVVVTCKYAYDMQMHINECYMKAKQQFLEKGSEHFEGFLKSCGLVVRQPDGCIFAKKSIKYMPTSLHWPQ